MKKIIIFISFVIIYNSIFGQGEISDKKIFKTKERSLAILINTNGIGGDFRYGKRIDGTRRKVYDIDFEYIKDQKEVKTRNPYYENNNRFVFGKLNDFFVFRGGMGLQKEIFSKSDKGGVAIKYFYSGGISLGLIKPIYYDIIDSTRIYEDKQYIFTNPKKFDNSIHTSSDIYGRTAFFRKGMDEITVSPGAFIKVGISIEYSKNEKNIHAIEAGIITDFFAKKVTIMDDDRNRQVFVSLFASLRFGKVSYQKDN